MSSILVTGCAGFIGHQLCKGLLDLGHIVYGVDNLNDYYDPQLKKDRLRDLGIETIGSNSVVQSVENNFYYFKGDIQDSKNLLRHFRGRDIRHVCHLAAQAGVRYSIENPNAYVESNLSGFLAVLEFCRTIEVEHLVYASSSSVYGLNREMPFSTKANVDHPISLYAASKKANELMAHSYSHLYGMSTTGLRFFTVYGPWGRPDMALFTFTDRILKSLPIDVYNNGEMSRDFTYVSDIVDGVQSVLFSPASSIRSDQFLEPDISTAPYRLYNIGSSRPISLMSFIHAIEEATGKKAKINFLPIQAGDVKETYADISALKEEFGFRPKVGVAEGVKEFVKWYQSYYLKNK